MDSTTSTSEIIAAATLLFRVGEHLYGCDIGDAQEIIPLRPTTRLPGAPPYVAGLINIRGTIVTVLDLGRRLHPDETPAADRVILLVRHHERLVGLIVDQVADVRVLDVESREPGGIVRGVASADAVAGMPSDGASEVLRRSEEASTSMPVVLLDLETLIKQVLLS